MSDNLLFSPLRIGRYQLSNRIFMAPMTRNRTPGHVPNPMNALYYAQRASAGLIITEGVAPSAAGQGYVDIPGLYNSRQEHGWRAVADAVHENGGRVFAQLMHVGRVSHPDFLDGEWPVAPSAVRARGEVFTYEGPKPFVTPRALPGAEVVKTIEDYALAAQRAVSAGLDGVEIHAANGYLPHQFLASAINLRGDEWGGSVTNRMRFVLEIVEAVTAAIGADRVGLRVSPGSTFNDMAEPDAAQLYPKLLQALEKKAIAYLHVVDAKPDFDVPALARNHFSGPLILNGGLSPPAAASAIEMGLADAVSFGQLFIANPDLPLRIAAGAELASADPDTFYGGNERGYTDYPSLSARMAA